MTSMSPPIASIRAQNFRAIAALPAGAGRRLRGGMLYRTGDLSRLGEACVEQLRALGIRSVVDLRSVAERRSHPYGWLEAIDADPWGDANTTSSAAIASLVRQSDAPTVDVRAAMMALYTKIPFSHAPSIGEIARRVITGRGPVVFGCAAGKDRTGVAAALLLWQLGVPRADIVADYLATNAAIDGLMAMVEKALGWDVRAPHVRAVMMADAEYLDATFAQVERHAGGIEGYFDTVLGIDAQGRKAFADVLTEHVAHGPIGTTRDA